MQNVESIAVVIVHGPETGDLPAVPVVALESNPALGAGSVVFRKVIPENTVFKVVQFVSSAQFVEPKVAFGTRRFDARVLEGCAVSL